MHGHAHFGTERGRTVAGIEVRNVAQPVLGRPYAIYSLVPGQGAEPAAGSARAPAAGSAAEPAAPARTLPAQVTGPGPGAPAQNTAVSRP